MPQRGNVLDEFLVKLGLRVHTRQVKK